MTVIQEMIETIGKGRPSWSSRGRASARLRWKAAFAGVESEVLRRAAVGFLNHQKGIPDTYKLWAEIRRVRGARVPESGLAPWRWGSNERADIQAELEEKGDPLADWLEVRGIPTVRKPEPLRFPNGSEIHVGESKLRGGPA